MKTDTITIHPTRHATDIMSNVPKRCPGCQRTTNWFRNLNGRSRCIACAQQQEQPTQEWYRDEEADRQYRHAHGE